MSRAQGYKLVKRAWAQIKDDIDESGIDRQELLSCSIQTLMAAAGQAMQQKNPGWIPVLTWRSGERILFRASKMDESNKPTLKGR